MSWFNNISGNLGNLSQIASNVTNFTKEVLQDAATESFDDIHTESEFQQNALNVEDYDYEKPEDLIRKITYLQNELQNLTNENTFKDEQIAFLQDENQTCRQYENHIENLKENLLEKEKEIELVAQRLQENDTVHQEEINKLNERNTDLEAKLVQQSNKSNDSIDNSWTDDWGITNTGQDIKDMAFKNECLTNDLAMKEIIVNTIETKMCEISNNTVEVSSFSDWIDGILHEKKISEDKFKQISYILEEKLNMENQWKEMCVVLEKHIGKPKESGNEYYLHHIDDFLVQNTNKCIELENENNEYRNIISNIENCISKFGDGYDNFKITNFNEWIDSIGSENFIYYNDSSKNVLEQIQSEIRENDDEDADFVIENFSAWLEKVQCRIDDLEVELINEQETRDAEEKQRILERETLNELFNQKQNEISLLKVELYNRTSSQTLNPIIEVEQEDLMTVHEQLNETTARCEALQHELATVQKQAMDAGDFQQQHHQLSADYKLTTEQLKNTEEKHEKVVTELTEKCNEVSEKNQVLESSNCSMKEELANLQTELDEIRTKYTSVSSELNQFTVQCNELAERCENLQNVETASNDLQLQITNLSAMNDCIQEQLVTSESSKESMQAELNDYRVKYDSISTEFERVSGELKQATNRYELLQAAETVSDSLQLQLNDLSADKEQLKEQLEISESSKDSLLAELIELKEKYSVKCVELDELSIASNEMKAQMDILQNEVSTLQSLQEQLQQECDSSKCGKEELLKTKEGVEIELEEYKVKYNKVCEEFEQLSQVNEGLSESNKTGKTAENELQDIKTEFHLLKLVQLQSEEDKEKLHQDFEALKQTNNELSSTNQHLTGEVGNVDADLNSMVAVLNKLVDKSFQPDALDISLTSETTRVLFESIRDLVEKYLVLENKSNEYSEVSEKYKTELQEKESKISEHVEIYNILVYIVKSIDELLPQDKKGNIIVEDTLSSTEISHYVSYVNTLIEFIQGIEKIRTEYVESNNVLKQDLEDTVRLLELEKTSNVDLLFQINQLNIAIGDNKNTIEQLQTESNKQTDSEELEKALQVERNTNEQYRTNLDQLNNTVNDYKKTIERLKSETAKPAVSDGGGGGSGMKFGALKKKLLELESHNRSLSKENEDLKKGSGGSVISDSSESTDELKHLRSLLNDKKQECECYEEECKMLKASLMGIQEESAVAKTALTECQSLKEKLIEYENMLETASTASDEATVLSRHHQEQLHNLSLMLMEKNEEIERYQEENEYLKSKVLEVENETSDLELIREECKQLKAMLVGKEHQNKIDDTITTLQTESKQLKQLVAAKDSELQYMQNAVLEKENELSNMELIREECKQLKQMLVLSGQNTPTPSNDSAELEAKNAEIIELRNSTSDMELLREECKQLKQMLLNNSQIVNEAANDESPNVSCQLLEAMLEDRDVQIAEQNAVITELQNKTSDMSLIQQECQQLKTMLAGKQHSELLNSPGVNSTNEYSENSFALQVQQLEEFIKEKEDDLKNKDREIELLTAKLLEKENAISDFDLIQNECKVLKDMLKEKEELFIELQNDFDTANDVLQHKNEEYKSKEVSCLELEQRMQESLNIIGMKDMEILRLTDEVTEGLAQDENLHILQTEYRNVEEHLKVTQNELFEVKQLLEKTDNEFNEVKHTLGETENECERLRLYAEQHAQLNISLQEKSDAVLNMKTELESLLTEKTSLLQLCHEKDSSMKLLEDRVENLVKELQENIANATEIQKQNVLCQEAINENTLIIHNQVNQINELIATIQGNEVEKRNLETIVNENEIIMKGQEEEIRKLQTIVDDSIKDTKEKMTKISQLESELFRSKEHQEQLLESIKLYSSKEDESTTCKNCEYMDNERKMMTTILENIGKILQLSDERIQIQDKTDSIIEQLSFIEASLPILLEKIEEKDIEISNLIKSKDEIKLTYEQCNQEKVGEINTLKTKLEESSVMMTSQKDSYDLKMEESKNEIILMYEQSIQENLGEINTLKTKLEESSALIISQKNSYDLKVQDLQSQLVESSDIQVLYQNKCSEYLELQEQFLQEQKKYKEQKSSTEIAANSKINEELECLRSELERNSHLYLNKNKECDTLKLEVLQLEETIHNLNLSLQQLKGFEETSKSIPTLQLTLSSKEEEINELKSTIEDNEQKLESSKKQKQILDEVLKAKGQLDREKEELLFQNEQRDRLIQEKEVALRHKDVTIREMEAKTKRELERLRSHMLMTEEAHTKDIIELQDREEALQQELDEAKQGLSKKSIILQDSSKQFQEHCVDLEEQLHTISAQRDAGVLELSKCHDQISADGTAIYNLQNALEQLQKEKTEQSEYLTSLAKRKGIEYESRIEELTEELNKTQGAMSEAALAVQGINKLNLELQQKENELKVCKEKMSELVIHLHQLEEERKKILEAADLKLDKSLLRNLFMKYFQAPNDKRTDILHVIGGLLGWTPEEIYQLGSGAAPSKVGGWINSVWTYGSPKKTASTPTKSKPTTPVYDANKSLSELFVKFLEDETAKHAPVDTTSLTLSNEVTPSVQMFVSPTTPDILAFHNNSGPDQRIPAPGQEIPRVHTHHAQSTLKSILTSGPY